MVGKTNISGNVYGKYFMNTVQTDEDIEEVLTVEDIDGNTYRIVQIGEQWWFAENLRTTRYANGESILLVTDKKEWVKLTEGAWCWYDNNSNHDNTHGKLYNWYAVGDSRNICPEGWHVPTDEEWYMLENFVDPTIDDPNAINWRGADAASKLKAPDVLFTGGSRGVRATNQYGFSAHISGYRHHHGIFLNIEGTGMWWTSTEYTKDFAWYRMMYYDLSNIRRITDNKKLGYSVRCIKD